ncbi:MAG: DUF5801 repeats-in-toxin domain-containing protein, partial [Pseudobdellovibrionaceae bacterium]|nr:DUF5801 repeats-in-toxin domain-containing protein [Pseudobdellovibrionaceae bacterium]
MPKDVNEVGITTAQKVFDLPVTLQPGQVNTLSFSQDSISTMQLTTKGELEISFRDGSRLVIENFEELANSSQSCGRDTLIQLSDNTIIYPDELQGQLEHGPVQFGSTESGIIALSEPHAGQVIEANIEPGHEYQMGFDLSNVSAVQAGQNLILSFPNGGVLILNNYFAAANTELPPVMTLADGAVVDGSALLASCKLVEIPTVAETVVAEAPPVTQLREAAPDIEPAAGEPAPSAEKIAQVEPAAGNDFANIEPAAGDAGGTPTSSSRGYGFNSSIDGASFGGEDPIGPIAPTALNYNSPTIPTIPYVSGQVGPSVPPTPIDDKPDVLASSAVVDETNLGSATGTVVVDYGRDGPGVLTFNDSFAYSGSVGPDLLSCQIPVVVTHTGDTYTGTANGTVVFTLVIDSATGEYTFTQYGPLTHADSTNPDDVLTLTFGVTATDSDGDAVTSTITIDVHDDGPVAANDTASVGSDPLVVTGDVLANDDAGTDGNGHVTAVEFNGTSYAVPAGGSTSVVGTYGTLVINSNGTYTYTSANTSLGTDRFTYAMADCDGDTDTATLSIEVTDLDVAPTIQSSTSILDESNISTSNSVSGTVVADFGVDGPGTYGFNTTHSSGGSLAGGTLTSNGVTVSVALIGGQYVGTAGGEVVFTLTMDSATGGYVFTQFKPLDHADGTNPNDSISLTFGVTATDSDGDFADTTITINVLDDAPVAADDSQTVPDNTLTITGDVTLNDSVGQDAPGYVVREVEFNGTSYNVPQIGTVSINGTYGVLVIGADGSYSYTSFNAALGSDAFVYTIQDQDGDTASAKLTLTVGDLDTKPTLDIVPEVVDETLVDESGIQTVNGTIVVDFGADGPGTVALAGAPGFSASGSVMGGSLTSNGVPVVVTQVGNQYVGTAGGEMIFELTLNPDNTYEFQLYGQLDHADATDPDDVITLNFGVIATDSDGDTATGTIQINVHDDAPIAVNDVVTVVDPNVSVIGNVTTNDYIGEDAPGYIVSEVDFNGTVHVIPQTGTVTINGTYGVLVIGSDGAYKYTSYNTTIGTDRFTYTILDQDGDPSSATVSFTVEDIDHQPCVENATIKVDETYVDDHGSQTVSGTLSVDYMGDGPGTVNPVAGSFTSG